MAWKKIFTVEIIIARKTFTLTFLTSSKLTMCGRYKSLSFSISLHHTRPTDPIHARLRQCWYSLVDALWIQVRLLEIMPVVFISHLYWMLKWSEEYTSQTEFRMWQCFFTLPVYSSRPSYGDICLTVDVNDIFVLWPLFVVIPVEITLWVRGVYTHCPHQDSVVMLVARTV